MPDLAEMLHTVGMDELESLDLATLLDLLADCHEHDPAKVDAAIALVASVPLSETGKMLLH